MTLIVPNLSAAPLADDTEVMIDPPHPMHQLLMERVMGSPGQDVGLTRPQRLTITFYAAILSWLLLALMVEAVITVL